MTRPIFLAPLFSIMATAAVLAAAEVEPRPVQAPLRYQRVYAPVDRIKDWPTREKKYLPLKSTEFERMLSLVNSGVAEEHGAFTVQIKAAEYRAHLAGEQLLTGRATLDVTHSGQSAVMLLIEPCNVAVQQATWLLPGQHVDAQTRKAALGLGSDGKCQVIVEQSGKLNLDWSLAGQRDPSDAMVFSCEFPACPVNVLWLELPESLTPLADKGIVSGAEAVAEGHRLWRIELGGNNRFHLRLLTKGAAADARPPLALLRESSVYEFSPRGVDLWAQWRIQTHNEALDKIVVMMEPGLQLATARLGDASVPYTIEPLEGNAGTRAVLSLSEPVQDAELILRLGAVAPMTLDRPCRLPRMQAAGLFWLEGSATLNVLDPLLIQRLVPIHCSQKEISPLAEPRIGESLQFQKFSPD
ncbi:MAG TPA: hypothetical protein VIH42_09360, partial [Thermoguttaceae bacterium]